MARRIGGNPRKNRGLWTGYPLDKSPAQAGGSSDVPQHTRITGQQDLSGWQEVAGYALLFTSALMPNANTIAAAEYQVGTHQAAIAASQDRSWVRGTPFTLIPSASGDVILRPTKVAAPEQRDSAYALTFHAPLTYLAVVVPPPSTLIEAPQQVDDAWALTFAPPRSYLSRVEPTATTIQAGEQTDAAPFSPAPWVRGTPDTLFPVVVGDTLPPATWVAAPEQIDGAYALTFKLATQYLANVQPLAETLVSLNEQADTYRAAITFGPEPAPIVVAGDVRIAGTILTHVQPDAERPSWVVLLSETLIPAPAVTPPATPDTEPALFVGGAYQDSRPPDLLHQDDDEIALIVTAFMTIRGSRSWPR